MSNQAIVLLPLPPDKQTSKYSYIQFPLWENGLPEQAGWDLYRSVPRLMEMTEASTNLGSLVTAEDSGVSLTLQNDRSYREMLNTAMLPRDIDTTSMLKLITCLMRGDWFHIRQHAWCNYDIAAKIDSGYVLNVELLNYTDALQIAEGSSATTWYQSDMAIPNIALFEKVYFWSTEEQSWFMRCLDEQGQAWMIPMWLYFSYQYGRSNNPYWTEMSTRLWKFYPYAYLSDKIMALTLCGEMD